MDIKGISLRGLEVFEALARSGSVVKTSQDTGLSQPAVSQQLRNLEAALATSLIDHSCRPMQLTPAGRNFLRHTVAALAELRLATAGASRIDLGHLSQLNIGLITDFDDNLTPHLVRILNENVANCSFHLISSHSHDLVPMVADGRLHMAICANTGETFDNILEFPLVRDPLVLVKPRDVASTPHDLLQGVSDVPLLRYTDEQLIARQIELHLTTQKQSHSKLFEIRSHMTLISMVAQGIGWTITSAAGLMRAKGLHDKITIHPLPGTGASRQISLYIRSDWGADVPQDIANAVRNLIERHIITPAHTQMPWLENHLELLDHEAEK